MTPEYMALIGSLVKRLESSYTESFVVDRDQILQELAASVPPLLELISEQRQELWKLRMENPS